MRTAVDSSVLLDVFTGDARFGSPSRRALQGARMAGGLVACEVVWAEVRSYFATAGEHAAASRVLADFLVGTGDREQGTGNRADTTRRSSGRREGGSKRRGADGRFYRGVPMLRRLEYDGFMRRKNAARKRMPPADPVGQVYGTLRGLPAVDELMRELRGPRLDELPTPLPTRAPTLPRS